MGVPLLFTDSGTLTTTVKVLSGLWPGSNIFPSAAIWPNEGPQMQLDAALPVFGEFSESVSVDPGELTFNTQVPTFPGLTGDVVAVDAGLLVFAADVPTFLGLPDVVLVDPGQLTFDSVVPNTSGGQFFVLVPSVRELPPLRLHVTVETPGGRRFRWGEDDPNPANVPNGLRFSDTVPGGFENQDCTLPREPNVEYSDLEPLSRITVTGAGGQMAWQGRLERAPRTSGDQVSVSPSAVGGQAYLDDDKTAREVYVDLDLSQWGSMSATRRAVLLDTPPAWKISEGQVAEDLTDPTLLTTNTGPWPGPAGAEATNRQGVDIGIVHYKFAAVPAILASDNNWVFNVGVANDDRLTSLQQSANLAAGGVRSGSGYFVVTAAGRKVAYLQNLYSPAAGVDGTLYELRWSQLAIYGRHGLQLVGAEPGGLWAEDIVADAVGRWAPSLNLTKGSLGSVRPTGFVVNHAVFREPTSAAEIVKSISRFGLWDWGVWDDNTFHFGPRGSTGRAWKARVGPTRLEETGPSVERLFESVMVQYSDVDGSTRTVGPPGSGADGVSSLLKDSDPDNPANRAGILRRVLLTMGTATPAQATEAGRRFLEEQKLLDSSGRASIVGHVESDRGVVFPYWAVRAGDTITFTDAASPTPRRVVRTEKDHGTRTCSVDLDAPPEGLQALLERLGVGLTDLGFS